MSRLLSSLPGHLARALLGVLTGLAATGCGPLHGPREGAKEGIVPPITVQLDSLGITFSTDRSTAIVTHDRGTGTTLYSRIGQSVRSAALGRTT